MSGVAARYNDLGQSTGEPGSERSSTRTEVTRILMQDHRHKTFGQHIAGDLIGGGACISVQETINATAIRRALVLAAGSRKREGRCHYVVWPIEGVMPRDVELLLCRQS